MLGGEQNANYTQHEKRAEREDGRHLWRNISSQYGEHAKDSQSNSTSLLLKNLINLKGKGGNYVDNKNESLSDPSIEDFERDNSTARG